MIGAQWGDEGKGKWVDILAESADFVVRFQGGNNAGHTLFIDGVKTVLHQIPSGILRQRQRCALSAGVVVNPVALVDEMRAIESKADVRPERLMISARAHVITPWSIHCDGLSEEQRQQPIGTTKRGIGPTYAMKAARSGLRLGHYINKEARTAWSKERCNDTPGFEQHYLNHRDQWQGFEDSAEIIAPYVCDAEHELRIAIAAGQTILLEGAQGALLDIDHGTYPFVTSSSTAAGGALASLGFAPQRIGSIYGVSKAYVTRVGSGPFPTELSDDVAKHMSSKGKEFGATTGRPRRCGWLDAVALRYAVSVNGLSGVILNKLDILSGLAEVKIATAYQHPSLGRIAHFPWDATILSECTPVYQSFPGWSEELPTRGKISDLPAAAQHFITAVEESIGTPITMVGTGVNRGDGLMR